MRRMVSRLDAVVTGCERARRNLEAAQCVSAPLTLIPPLTHLAGVPVAVERPYDEACRVRIVMTGRMGFGKGLGALLRVWDGLKIGDAELHLHGPLDSDFAQRAARRTEEHRQVHFHGPFEREALPAILSQADLGLMLSIEEGYGLVVWEYMACGLPFVTTDCGAADEFTVGNPDAMKVPVSEEGIRVGIEAMVRALRENRLSRPRLQALHRRSFSYERAAAMHVQAVVDPGAVWPALFKGR
jgi:glycosyltransferase involved in cell wall biosynthesis